MKKNIITIIREFGSGGGMIGKMVAEQLGIPCYDREMIDSVAKETGFDPTYIEDTEQQVTCPMVDWDLLLPDNKIFQ